MSSNFEIEYGVLYQYHGSDAHVTIPDGVTKISDEAFKDCTSLTSVVIPNSVTEIGYEAFQGCTSLSSIVIPNSVTEIESEAFQGCTSLTSVVIPNSVTEIGILVFQDCSSLSSVVIPNSLTEIGSGTFKDCTSLSSIVIPNSVKEIGVLAFKDCTSLSSVIISSSVTEIGSGAFDGCSSLSSIDIPDNVTKIGEGAFAGCTSLSSVVIPDSVTEIGGGAFEDCTSLSSIDIPDSVTEIVDFTFKDCTNMTSAVIPDSVITIGDFAFINCDKMTIIGSEGSCAHQYCLKDHRAFLFNYQYEAFGGLIPPGVEMLSSPFLADEEQPFIFISYSHKDRDRVFPILKTLYEAGWRIWYDEGLTIGDSYDEVLEKHVRNCSSFLLFVTENSLNSLYIERNEVPWAIRFEKPIIKCILDDGEEYEISESSVIATVSPSEIEPTLGKINELTKGEPRTAKGITVAVDPANRSEAAEGEGFAYCLYAPQSAATAKAILFEAKNSGCALYDAVENGTDEEKLKNAACLIVFLDKVFLSDQALIKLLTEAFKAGRDIAVCRLEDVAAGDYPPELSELDKMHALNFVHGITPDMNKKLTRHLQKRGCRDSTALPGFEYEKTDDGIVIKEYTGTDPAPKLEREYGGIPVVIIGDRAFHNCVRLKTFIIPDGVTEIGVLAFEGCTSLSSVDIPDSVTEISVFAFEGCSSLSSVVIPDSVTEIGGGTFKDCTSLSSVVIPDSVTEIGDEAFKKCKSLSSVVIPNSVTRITDSAFEDCKKLTVFCPRGSIVWKYCKKNKIPVKSIKHAKKQ